MKFLKIYSVHLKLFVYEFLDAMGAFNTCLPKKLTHYIGVLDKVGITWYHHDIGHISLRYCMGVTVILHLGCNLMYIVYLMYKV